MKSGEKIIIKQGDYFYDLFPTPQYKRAEEDMQGIIDKVDTRQRIIIRIGKAVPYRVVYIYDNREI